MSESLSLLSSKTTKLKSRRRAKRRTKQRTEVLPAIQPPDLKPALFGCPADVLDPKLAEADPDRLGVVVSRQERDLISLQSRKQRKKLPNLIIESISYTIFSHEELEAKAVYEAKNTNEEGLYSVNDPRGGVVDANKLCKTCYLDNMECPGHYGIIKFAEPIIHPSFIKETIYVLTSVCNSCGGLLLPLDQIKEKGIFNLSGSKRLRALADASEKIPCRKKHEDEQDIVECKPNPIFKDKLCDNIHKITYTYDPKERGTENIMAVENIEAILDSITDEEAEIMGFSGGSHPRNFIMKSLAVIPLCARAPVVQDGMLLKDDLTSMYKDIIRYNEEIKKYYTLPEKDRKRAERDKAKKLNSLIFSIEHLIDNSDSKYKQGKKKIYQDIKARIQGKEALIRSSMMGKRVNFSARTVLSPDPNLKFGQVRIPRVMAPYLTQHETVTPSNINRLTSLLRTGKVTYIIPSHGKLEGMRIKVDKKLAENWKLTFGDEVDRWLQNGDYVVFNRQPTLHRLGFMGYEVVLGEPKTIALHLASTIPSNADFDGDEAAIHAPQSEDAVREVAGIMSARCNLMNSQNNKNTAAVTFDALTGNYILTQPDTFVDADTFMDIVAFLENSEGLVSLNERLDEYNVPRLSGRALFSSILPKDFYYRKGDVYIRDGILIQGVVNKEHLGQNHNSIIQVMYKEYGQDRTVDFLTDVYNIAGRFLDTHGFSVGMDDCFLTGEDPQKTINYEIQRARMLVKSMGVKLLDPLEEERREKQIMAYLDVAKGTGVKISKENLGPNNSINVMARSGAKGSTMNIAQITGILGQMYLRGERMPETISGGTRSLPYFPEDSLNPEARGFIVNSFLTGLSPAEYFWHMSSSREGLMDTAVRTQDTGDMHHRIVKALEDIKIYNDGSVRNAFGDIFSFIYGEDGFDAGELQQVETKTGSFASFINVKMVTGKINSKYGYATPGDPKPKKKVGEEFIKPKTTDTPAVPVLGITVTIGDKVKTELGVGEILEIDGNRVSVQIINEEGIETNNWFDIEKIEKI